MNFYRILTSSVCLYCFLTLLGCREGSTRGSAPTGFETSEIILEMELPGTRPPLHEMVTGGRVASIRRLIDAGVDPNLTDYKGWTALHYTASYHDCPEVAKFLLSRGAKVDARTKAGVTPLGVAARYSGERMVRAILDAGANVNARDIDGYTPLSHAVWDGPLVTANLLIKNGAMVDIFSAVGLGDAQKLEALLKVDPAHAHRTDGKGRGLVHWAAANGKIDIIKMLHKAGVKVDDALEGIPTPLAVAIEKGWRETAEYLVERGARSNQIPWMLVTEALVDAVEDNDKKMMVFLLSLPTSVNIDAPNKGGVTPLLAAVNEKKYETADFLLRNGAYIDAVCDGATVLHFMVMRQAPERVRRLLQHGASTSMSERSSGDTPLHTAVAAVSEDSITIIKLLLGAGSDPHIKNKKGSTPLDKAKRLGAKEIVDLLEQKR
ncbi:MAG: hypothetical protein HN350_19920 [Phycisphaerales bacterium]|nr:hypothetical protein [Phycisphaerales bacterium]